MSDPRIQIGLIIGGWVLYGASATAMRELSDSTLLPWIAVAGDAGLGLTIVTIVVMCLMSIRLKGATFGPVVVTAAAMLASTGIAAHQVGHTLTLHRSAGLYDTPLTAIERARPLMSDESLPLERRSEIGRLHGKLIYYRDGRIASYIGPAGEPLLYNPSPLDEHRRETIIEQRAATARAAAHQLNVTGVWLAIPVVAIVLGLTLSVERTVAPKRVDPLQDKARFSPLARLPKSVADASTPKPDTLRPTATVGHSHAHHVVDPVSRPDET